MLGLSVTRGNAARWKGRARVRYRPILRYGLGHSRYLVQKLDLPVKQC